MKRLLGCLVCIACLGLTAVAQTPAAVTGALSAANCPALTGCVTMNATGWGSVGIGVTGTFTGTITFEASMDNATYTALSAFPSNSTTSVTTTTGTGLWNAGIGGFAFVRARMSSYTSGTARVTLQPAMAGGVGAAAGGLSPTGDGTGLTFNTGSITALGGNFSTSGAFSTALTVTGTTAVTLPTSGTLVNNAVTTLSSLTSVGTLTSIAVSGGGTFSQTTAGSYKFGTSVADGVVNMQADLTAVNLMVMKTSANSTGGFFVVFENAAGSSIGSITELAGAASVAFNATSDRRLKNDLGQVADLSGLRNLIVHDFTWKTDGSHDRGLFAQEAYGAIGRGVTPGRDDDLDAKGLPLHPWQVSYSSYVPDLIAGWQEHDRRIADLEAYIRRMTVVQNNAHFR